MSTRPQRTFPSILLLFATIPFVIAPFYSYFENPVFLWEISSPAYLKGGAEALVFLAVFWLFVTAPLARGWRVMLVCAGAELYLRLHNADVPFLFGLVWLEGMLAVGALAPITGIRASGPLLFSLRFIFGISMWTLGMLGLSLVHLASPAGLAVYSSLLFLAAILWGRKQPFSVRALRYLTHHDRVTALVCTYVFFSVLILFARGGPIVDFDSIWYGLRSAWVLAPHGSIFERLNLLGQVFYYPKLFESLSLPVSWAGEYPLIYGIQAVIYLAMGIGAWAFARVAGIGQRASVLTMALVLSPPVMTTMALTAKPDLLGNYFLLIGGLFFIIAIRRTQPAWFIGVFAADALALSTKLSALPFGTLLCFSALVIWAWFARGRGFAACWQPRSVRRVMSWLIIAGTVIFLAFCWRTYYLTGYPFVGDSSIAAIFNILGCAPRYPVFIRSDVTAFAGEPVRVLFDYLFAPSHLQSASMDWPGNSGALLFLVGALCALVAKRPSVWLRITWALFPILLAGLILAATFGASAGGTGYYYMFPATLATLLGVGLLWRSPGMRFAATCAMAALLAVNATLGFLLSPGAQAPGTGEPTWNLLRSPWEAREAQQQLLQSQGMGPISDFIQREMPHDCRAIAGGDWAVVYSLPCTVENLGLAQEHIPLFQSREAFAEYLNSTRVNLLIVPRFPAENVFHDSAELLHAEGLPAVETPLYFAVDLRPILGRVVLPPDPVGGRRQNVQLLDLLKAAVPVDGTGNAAPGAGQYGIAPNGDLYYTGELSLILRAGSGVRFPLERLLPDKGWRFSAEAGLTPDDVLANGASLLFTARILAADGRELAKGSWPVAAGSPLRISLDSPQSSAAPAYLELDCSGAGPVRFMLIGAPRLETTGVH